MATGGSGCRAICSSKRPKPHSSAPHMRNVEGKIHGRRLQGLSMSSGRRIALFIVFDCYDKMFNSHTACSQHSLHHHSLRSSGAAVTIVSNTQSPLFKAFSINWASSAARDSTHHEGLLRLSEITWKKRPK